MLKLKQVSKFYYSKGMVASGFNKVSLNFDVGEFIAITGESGSGKSTLLNVISGLDSYEEGEMYINGNETSHYTEKDYEIYRKKYIGNIFQNFNLVNSYTVYQNIELVLLLNGMKKKDVKKQIIEIIKQVDLLKYKNRKVSKLSGGQKQRVAIARALAQNTPIILADEPTGNLDSKSSESVLKLLYEISKNKLVIVVTHNYDQIEKYVTRKILMHDGKVIEDKKIKDYEETHNFEEAKYYDIKWYNKIRLGFRNAFNIIPKFLLIMTVYLFIVFSIFLSYSSFKQSEYDASTFGTNRFFKELSDKRIVIKKNDKTPFTNEDYEKIKKNANVDKIVENDLSLDTEIGISDLGEDVFFYGTTVDIKEFNGKIEIGRLPSAPNEILLLTQKENYYITDIKEEILNKEYYINDLSNHVNGEKYKITIVGISYKEKNDSNYYMDKLYMSSNTLADINNVKNREYSTLKYIFNNMINESYFQNITGEIIPSSKVAYGKAVIPEEWQFQCKNYNCKNYSLYVNMQNLYYTKDLNLKVSSNYTKKTFNKLTGYKYEDYNGAIFINEEEYNSLFQSGYYQSSVIIKDEKIHEQTIKDLENMGISTLYIKDVITTGDNEAYKLLKITKTIVMSILIIVLFFISYFIIKLILKSRNIYFSTLRILGASFKSTKDLLNIELLVISHLSFIIFGGFILSVYYKVINIPFIFELNSYVTMGEYLFIYLVLISMSLLISNRYSRKLFSNTAMNVYRDEVE